MILVNSLLACLAKSKGGKWAGSGLRAGTVRTARGGLVPVSWAGS